MMLVGGSALPGRLSGLGSLAKSRTDQHLGAERTGTAPSARSLDIGPSFWGLLAVNFLERPLTEVLSSGEDRSLRNGQP
jgi:hypothetical protein